MCFFFAHTTPKKKNKFLFVFSSVQTQEHFVCYVFFFDFCKTMFLFFAELFRVKKKPEYKKI